MDNNFDNYDFEEWEGDYQLIQEEDWAGLVKLRKHKAEKYPDDLHNQWRYGEALVYNQEFEKALKFLTPIYKKEPEYSDVIHSILDALYGLGKTENDFAWMEKPIVLKLDEQTKKLCEDFLKNKRRRTRFYNLIEHFIIQSNYMTFKEKELYVFLKKDKRFEFTNEEDFWEAKIKLSKK
ncbi:MAG TPA: hypothetical protein VE912_13785 [Bacteroidales bacterium]|nr:hypothetical protein [Bacteroidales bacterium]